MTRQSTANSSEWKKSLGYDWFITPTLHGQEYIEEMMENIRKESIPVGSPIPFRILKRASMPLHSLALFANMVKSLLTRYGKMMKS